MMDIISYIEIERGQGYPDPGLTTLGLVWFHLTSASVTSRHHRRSIDAYNSRDRPVKYIIVSPTMSDRTQWVRVKIGLSKTLLRSTDRKIFLVKKKK